MQIKETPGKCVRARWSKEKALLAKLTYPANAPRSRCPPTGPKKLYDTPYVLQKTLNKEASGATKTNTKTKPKMCVCRR